MPLKIRIALSLATANLLLACTTSGNVGTNTDFCAIAKPIYISSRDVLTDETARQILALNEAGAKICSWRGE